MDQSRNGTLTLLSSAQQALNNRFWLRSVRPLRSQALRPTRLASRTSTDSPSPSTHQPPLSSSVAPPPHSSSSQHRQQPHSPKSTTKSFPIAEISSNSFPKRTQFSENGNGPHHTPPLPFLSMVLFSVLIINKNKKQ
ncbi:hypothetical protein niasHS_007623 [Heterodera schachtii]|uniref:Uncharacterized protein n=1 Tax=Heterodera schachtii TaxID=97005 RepID=A0ABD2JP74_HETSC